MSTSGAKKIIRGGGAKEEEYASQRDDNIQQVNKNTLFIVVFESSLYVCQSGQDAYS